MFVSFSSLDFPDPAEVSVCNSDEVSYTILEKGTERGKPLLVESRGYSYSVKRQYKKSTEWRCTVRNSKVKCGATVKQLDKTTFQCGPIPHCHQCLPELLPCAKVKEQVSLCELSPCYN